MQSIADNALVTIHKRGLPGQFFWTSRTGPGGTPTGCRSFFCHPAGARVTFNLITNLKITRAPAINKPRIKPVNCPTGARRGPCRDPPGTHFEGKHAEYPPESPTVPGGGGRACGVLPRLVGDKGGVPPVPLQCRTGTGRDL